jgi:hypothetical protein
MTSISADLPPAGSHPAVLTPSQALWFRMLSAVLTELNRKSKHSVAAAWNICPMHTLARMVYWLLAIPLTASGLIGIFLLTLLRDPPPCRLDFWNVCGIDNPAAWTKPHQILLFAAFFGTGIVLFCVARILRPE